MHTNKTRQLPTKSSSSRQNTPGGYRGRTAHAPKAKSGPNPPRVKPNKRQTNQGSNPTRAKTHKNQTQQGPNPTRAKANKNQSQQLQGPNPPGTKPNKGQTQQGPVMGARTYRFPTHTHRPVVTSPGRARSDGMASQRRQEKPKTINAAWSPRRDVPGPKGRLHQGGTHTKEYRTQVTTADTRHVRHTNPTWARQRKWVHGRTAFRQSHSALVSRNGSWPHEKLSQRK